MRVILAATAALTTTAALSPATVAATLTTFRVPGAMGTYPTDINSKGQIVGTFAPGNDAFIRDANGVITTFHLGTQTGATAINQKRHIVGAYTNAKGKRVGFVRRASGGFKSFHVPGAGETVAEAINRNGEIVGVYDTPGSGGFYRSPNGSMAEFTAPGCQATYALAINDSGVAAGSGINCGSPQFVGMIRATDGSLETFTVNGMDTFAYDLNGAGAVTGTVITGSTTRVGFIRGAHGAVATFSGPASNYTESRAINRSGTAAGDYNDAAGKTHGFVRAPDGTMTAIDVAGEAFTLAVSINNSGAVTGYGGDVDSGTADGFIWHP
jgi:hypothetical protein